MSSSNEFGGIRVNGLAGSGSAKGGDRPSSKGERATLKMTAVKRKSRLRLDANPDYKNTAVAIIVMKKTGKKWRRAKWITVTNSKHRKTINLGKGKYKARVKAHSGLRKSTWSYARLKR